jgi:hypothetical protein
MNMDVYTRKLHNELTFNAGSLIHGRESASGIHFRTLPN